MLHVLHQVLRLFQRLLRAGGGQAQALKCGRQVHRGQVAIIVDVKVLEDQEEHKLVEVNGVGPVTVNLSNLKVGGLGFRV